MTRSTATSLRLPFGLLCILAPLAGCPEPTVPRDTGVDAPSVPPDTANLDIGMVDVPMTMPDTPGGRVCGLGTPGCDVISQNCEDSGGTPQGCYFVSDETMSNTICAESGMLGEGVACTGGVNTCAEGLACYDGFCRDYCCMGAASDCALGYLCRTFGSASGPTPVGICVPPDDCTVIPQSGCDADEACQPSDDGTLTCVLAGPNALGENCGPEDGDCTAGNVCVGPTGGPFTCVALCLMADPSCRTGTTCMATGGIGGGYGTCR